MYHSSAKYTGRNNYNGALRVHFPAESDYASLSSTGQNMSDLL